GGVTSAQDAIDNTILANFKPDAKFPPRTEKLEINYNAVTFSATSKVRFQYRLSGLDDRWVEAGTRRQAFYTNLRTGHYQFLVRATTNGSTTSTATWTFEVQPAFYQHAWFYVLCATGASLGIYASWAMRVRLLRKQFAVVIEERARIGREIHDTVLQSMTG